MSMEDDAKEEWTRVLSAAEAELGFNQGFKPLYSPWRLLKTGKIAFISLNPGRAPARAELRMVSDERGNSYEAEQFHTVSPLNPQFLRLCELLEVAPSKVITGVAAPFRSNAWGSLTPYQRQRSLEYGQRFWSQTLQRPDLRLIFSCSKEATSLVTGITGATQDCEVEAAWGNVLLRRYVTHDRRFVVQLPHLSRFRLLGRPESEAAIQNILAA